MANEFDEQELRRAGFSEQQIQKLLQVRQDELDKIKMRIEHRIQLNRLLFAEWLVKNGKLSG